MAPPTLAVMFIAEAPGRLGGELSGRPLVDDASGKHFTALLSQAGIDRNRIFITNAVLCNPQQPSGLNRKPTRAELEHCNGWLRQQIQVVDPLVVVTLGSVALAALSPIEAHDLTLRSGLRSARNWFGRTLIALYHPSPLTRASRSDADQTEDYRWLGEYLRARGMLAEQASGISA